MMTTAFSPGDELQRFPMSWEEYLALDDDFPGEYFGGDLVVAPSPSQQHQDIEFRLQMLLHQHLAPGTKVTRGWGWSPPGVREELIPDLMVHHETPEQRALTGIPLLVVEIVSSMRAKDYVAKAQRYARWGAPTYWIVDPRDHEIGTFELQDDGLYVETGSFGSGVQSLAYGDVEVPVDIDALFKR